MLRHAPQVWSRADLGLTCCQTSTMVIIPKMVYSRGLPGPEPAADALHGAGAHRGHKTNWATEESNPTGVMRIFRTPLGSQAS